MTTDLRDEYIRDEIREVLNFMTAFGPDPTTVDRAELVEALRDLLRRRALLTVSAADVLSVLADLLPEGRRP